jgi:hypothetical protein
MNNKNNEHNYQRIQGRRNIARLLVNGWDVKVLVRSKKVAVTIFYDKLNRF